MANVEQGSQKLSAADKALRPNGTEVLVAEGKTPDIFSFKYSNGGEYISVIGVRIPPIPWREVSETRWIGIGWEFYNQKGEYVGGGEEAKISAEQSNEIKDRIVKAETRIAKIGVLGENINCTTAANKASSSELFG